MAIGAFAANPAIYRIGMNVADATRTSGRRWEHAFANPIAPRVVETAPCQDIVITGRDLDGPGHGLEALPIPISTPGFDAAPYLTATCVITRDPETGIAEPRHLSRPAQVADPARHDDARQRARRRLRALAKYQAKGERMPVAIVVGCPPVVAFRGRRSRRTASTSSTIAGGLAGAPINVVRAKTVDLLVPAESEVVIEGFADPDYLEPEGPFGESHGYVALEDYNLVIEVTAITRRRNAIVTSIISQVTPSESSVVKRIAYEPMFLAHLRDALGIKGIKRVRHARAADQPAQARDPAIRARAARSRKSGGRSTAR